MNILLYWNVQENLASCVCVSVIHSDSVYLGYCLLYLYCMCVCVWNTRFTRLGYAETSFADVPSYIDRFRHDRFIGSRIFCLLISLIIVCISYLCHPSNGTEIIIETCVLYIIIIYYVRSFVYSMLCGVCVYVYILLYTAARSSQRIKRK